MKLFLCTLLTAASLTATPAWAVASQNLAQIRDTVAAFVQAQTKAIPGKVSIQVAEMDRRTNLPACPSLQAFLAPGAQLNGNSSVGVRCTSKYSWSLFVPVTIKISVNMLTANKTLLQGQTLRADDLGSLPSESLQTGTLTDPAQAVGKIMKYSLAAGQILRQDMLRAPYTVKQGQQVQLKVSGSGFKVSAEGQAWNNAAEGETTTARTASGQIVSGVVRGGTIEVTP
jgi:flagellar basal body P-ring formation protein FlgA